MLYQNDLVEISCSTAVNRSAAVARTRKTVLLGAGLLLSLLMWSALAPAQGVSGLKVQDRSHDNDPVDAQLYAHYEIDNTSQAVTPAAVPLSSLTMRYWFTNENPSDPLVFAC